MLYVFFRFHIHSRSGIVKNKDKPFAIEVFNYIKLKGEAWAEIGAVYIRALLYNDEIANEVLGVKAFNVLTSKFAKDLKSYCKKFLEIQK